jgi:hypothetical protein
VSYFIMDNSGAKTTSPLVSRLSPVEAEVIELFVQFSRALSLPRSYAEIYGLLFVSPSPLTQNQLEERLQISKDSTSMGDAMLGLVHPCKIYNMLAVGAPVIYIGPQPSHVTEILDQPGAGHPWCSVRHGEGELLAHRIRQLRERAPARLCPTTLTATFAKDVLLPQLIAGLEKMGESSVAQDSSSRSSKE